jgi:hypothetical protein
MPKRPEHPVFKAVDTDRPIWRYMDFAKFCSLLHRKALFFSRADLLGDPLEGSFTRAMEIDRERLLRNPPEGMTTEMLESVFKHNRGFQKMISRAAYINCWHLDDHESMAMWTGYGNGYGVALRSTAGRLEEVLPATFNGTGRDESLWVGPVTYLDYRSETERVSHENNAYGPFMCKSTTPYKHEAEFRGIFTDIPGAINEASKPGYFVPVDLQGLITEIVVSPHSQSWFEEVVITTRERFGYDFKVSVSTARMQPVH